MAGRLSAPCVGGDDQVQGASQRQGAWTRSLAHALVVRTVSRWLSEDEGKGFIPNADPVSRAVDVPGQNYRACMCSLTRVMLLGDTGFEPVGLFHAAQPGSPGAPERAVQLVRRRSLWSTPTGSQSGSAPTREARV